MRRGHYGGQIIITIATGSIFSLWQLVGLNLDIRKHSSGNGFMGTVPVFVQEILHKKLVLVLSFTYSLL